MILLGSIERDAKVHALNCYPEEAVGFVIGDRYAPQENISEDPEKTFRVSDVAYIKASSSGELVALIHSHPDGPLHPTADDMECQAAMAVPWGIFGTDGQQCSALVWLGSEKMAPLIGRDFCHGIYDCYSLVKDYYRSVMFIDLPDYFRDHEWWNNGGNMYLDNFKKAGFKRLPEDAIIQRGDMFMMRILSPVPNHAGIYIGNGLILHHLQGYLSKREPLGNWRKKIVGWYRHAETD